ncbi:MAG TPA: hypothetical protein VNF47_18395 [Streptosporangiaceae bacterium]|nr:hypothetical protein [Streptosporangiaceae bacterium]
MKKALTGLTLALLTMLATAGTASAATQQVSQYHFNGTFAETLLFASTASSETSTYVRFNETSRGDDLVAEQFTQNYDAQHNFTGATDKLAEVTSGFAVSIDTPGLATASVTAFDLPATTCIYDANFNQVSCGSGTMNLDVTWTGEGPITHSTSASHVKAGGFSVTDHLNGTSRDGTATGNLDGQPVGASQYAILGKAVSGSTTICIGSNC